MLLEMLLLLGLFALPVPGLSAPNQGNGEFTEELDLQNWMFHIWGLLVFSKSLSFMKNVYLKLRINLLNAKHLNALIVVKETMAASLWQCSKFFNLVLFFSVLYENALFSTEKYFKQLLICRFHIVKRPYFKNIYSEVLSVDTDLLFKNLSNCKEINHQEPRNWIDFVLPSCDWCQATRGAAV